MVKDKGEGPSRDDGDREGDRRIEARADTDADADADAGVAQLG